MTLSSSTAPYDSKNSTEKKPGPVKGKSPAPDSKLSLPDKQLSPDNEEDQIQSNIKNINTSIKPSLLGCELYNQPEINKSLEEVISKRSTNNLLSSTTCVTQDNSVEHEHTTKNDEAIPNDEMELEEECADSTVHLDVLTVSMALVQSASDLQKSQLYRYLYKTAHNQEPSSLFLPKPMMSVLSSSKITAGKLYMINNLMISMKKKLSAMQAIKQLTDIYRQLELIVQQKPTSNMRSDNGALTPTLDKPEQALDIVRDAISSAGYSIEDEVIIAIRFAANDIYDKDKQKYEICMNTYKSCDELVSVYVDLCERYPEIKILIDPFLARDREGCLTLKEKIGENCVIINQESFPNNPKITRKILNKGFVSGNIMKMENASTVVQFLEQVKAIEDCRGILFVLQNEVETDGHFIVDMAVAVQSDYIIFGGAGCSKNIEKYNRLVAIEHDMNILNVLIQREPNKTHF